MAMIRPAGKAARIAQAVLKKKGVKVVAGSKVNKTKPSTPFLQH